MYKLYGLSEGKEYFFGRFSSWKEADAFAQCWRFIHYRIYVSMCGVNRLVKEVKEGVVLHE